MSSSTFPVIDISSLRRGDDPTAVARALRAACVESGFFYVSGHGVPAGLLPRLESLSRAFFARPLEEKNRIRMELGGRAWRGFFSQGSELTSGQPDQKEGLYFGAELSSDHPDVAMGLPLHGANLFPDVDGFRSTVLEVLSALTELGHLVMRGLSISLDLDPAYFHDRCTKDPLVLFRIFNYPHLGAQRDPGHWGVGEHTDYGLLTLLYQDESGGLEVRSPRGWISAPPLPGTFVCNIGDMLERMTGGHFRSTPHRVRNDSPQDRLSAAFFFDPNFHARIEPIPGYGDRADPSDVEGRWDQASVHAFEGTYGDYLLAKVSKVFPALSAEL